MSRRLASLGVDEDAVSGRALTGRRVAIAVAGAVACALAFAAFRPGMSNPDMVVEYLGLQRGRYSDWHPPMLAFIWGAIDPVLPGKAGLFALFTVGYGACALAMLLCALRVSRLAAVLVAAVLVAPCFTAQGVALYKDFFMALVLGAGAATASLWGSAGRQSLRAGLWPVSLACTLVGALTRANAVFAAGPLLLSLTKGEWPFRRVRLLLLSGAISAALIPASSVLNEAAFHPIKMSVLDSLLIFDFAGITHFSGDNVFPDEVRPTFSVADNEICYSPVWWDPFVDWRDFSRERFGTTEDLGFARVVNPNFSACQQVWRIMRQAYLDHGRSFARDWLAAIARHPFAYAAHRLSHFNQSLGWLVPLSSPVARLSEQPNPYGWTFEPGAWAREVLMLANAAGSLPPAWPFVWLLAAVVSFFSADRIIDPATRRLVLALSLSGTLYTLGFLVVGLGSGYRYEAWLFLSSGVAAALAIAEAAQRREVTALLVRYAAWTAPFILLACVFRALKLSVF